MVPKVSVDSFRSKCKITYVTWNIQKKLCSENCTTHRKSNKTVFKCVAVFYFCRTTDPKCNFRKSKRDKTSKMKTRFTLHQNVVSCNARRHVLKGMLMPITALLRSNCVAIQQHILRTMHFKMFSRHAVKVKLAAAAACRLKISVICLFSFLLTTALLY